MFDKVWYACYGSNILNERFMCYISGGIAEGSAKKEIGCRDKTPPKRIEPYVINRRLFFAGYNEKWDNKGVAFIDSKENNMHPTLGRVYLITWEQFKDVVCQENSLEINADLNIDVEVLKSKGFQDVFPSRLYGRLLLLGEKEGYPIISFTYVNKEEVTIPSEKYLAIIKKGLIETYGCYNRFDDSVIDRYLIARMHGNLKSVFAVKATCTRHRKKTKTDYVISVHPQIKKQLNLGKYAVAKSLRQNIKETDEWLTISVYGKVVKDSSLAYDEVAIDQTLRNALGIQSRGTDGEYVRLAPLKRTLIQRIAKLFRPGQRLYARTNMSMFSDMEKNICRIPENSMDIAKISQGNHICIDSCIPKMYYSLIKHEKHDWRSVVNNTEVLRKEIENTWDMTIESEYKTVYDLLAEREISTKEIAKVRNIYEWECDSFRIVTKISHVYATDQDVINSVKNGNSQSISGMLPNAGDILGMENDIDTINMDGQLRDMLGIDPLKPVKVYRRMKDQIISELIEYGTMLVLAILSVFTAINSENISMLPQVLIISCIFTVLCIYLRTKN